MSDQPSSIRYRTIFAWCVAIVLFGLWSSPIGYLAVKLACNDDGGEFIERTVFAEGYSIDHQGARCYECLFDLATRRFSYVDHNILNPELHPLAASAGYNRYTTSDLESEPCRAWRASEWFLIRGAGYGFASDECVTLEAVEQPSPYHYSHTKTTTRGLLRALLNVNEYKVVVVQTGEVLAAARNYSYRPLMKRIWPEWSSPIWQCSFHTQQFTSEGFRQRVLRNDSSARTDGRREE